MLHAKLSTDSVKYSRLIGIINTYILINSNTWKCIIKWLNHNCQSAPVYDRVRGGWGPSSQTLHLLYQDFWQKKMSFKQKYSKDKIFHSLTGLVSIPKQQQEGCIPIRRAGLVSINRKSVVTWRTRRNVVKNMVLLSIVFKR